MARLDFLWQLQARDEKLDMEALQGSNRLGIIDEFNIWSIGGVRPDIHFGSLYLYFWLSQRRLMIYLFH